MIVVTGAGGFVGRCVVQNLRKVNREHVGTIFPSPRLAGGDAALLAIDLTGDWSALASRMESTRAHTLVHAAFPSREQLSTDVDAAAATAMTIDECVIAACRLCTTLRKVVIVSSGAVYGDLHPAGTLISESYALAPNGRYGEIKLAQEQGWAGANLDIELVVARPFNITGPGEPTTLVSAMSAHRMANPPFDRRLDVYNSESVRDFLDVRDVAAAIVELIDVAAGVYNIASGEPVSILGLTECLASVSRAAVTLAPDGKGTTSWSCGDAAKLRAATGWSRRYELRSSLSSVWEEQWQLRTPADRLISSTRVNAGDKAS